MEREKTKDWSHGFPIDEQPFVDKYRTWCCFVPNEQQPWTAGRETDVLDNVKLLRER
jgi:hypothetical protein